jgi:hypothetical protein
MTRKEITGKGNFMENENDYSVVGADEELSEEEKEMLDNMSGAENVNVSSKKKEQAKSKEQKKGQDDKLVEREYKVIIAEAIETVYFIVA